jgi:hypothetical protein
MISTPDKGVYTERLGVRNPYHCPERAEKEFESALRARFHDVHFYNQRLDSVAWWSPRTIVCESTLWRHVRGFQRLRRAVQSRFFPEAVRASAVDVILKVARNRRRLLNQYVVRSRQSWHRERSAYIVATAVS